MFPYALLLVPDDDVPDLPSLDRGGPARAGRLLVDVLERLDRLFDAQTPYMLWIHQRPFDGERLAGRPAARGDRVAVARAGRDALRRGGRARLGRVLQPRRCPRTRRASLREALAHRARSRRCCTMGGGRSWERPELDEPEPRCRRARRSPRSAARCSLDGDVGASRSSPAPRTRASRRTRLARGRGAGPVDDAGLRRAAVHERRRCRSTTCRRRCPSRTRPASTGGGSTIPRGWRDRRVVLHFGGAEGALHVLAQRRAGRDREGLPHAGRVRRHASSFATTARTS